MSRVLLLLHPTVVTEPELVSRIKHELEVNEELVEQQIIDRVTKGHVELEKNAYSKIVYVNPNTDKSIPAAMMTLLHDSLTNNGVCSGDLPKDQNLDVLMSGFIVDEEKQVWIKPAPVETVSIPLKKKTEGTSALKKMPKFKKLETEDSETSKRTLQESKLAYFSQSDDSDDEDDDKEYGYGYNNSKIIDENDLIKDSKSTNLIIPKACELPNGKKRRKACKDCTCGLKELEENEDLQRRNLQNSILGQTVQSANLEAIKIEERLKKNQQSVKLTDEDLTEIDFTVEGKQGGCGSCALGDAFRCDGCPYLGLPPFQPGQAITIDSLGEDI